MKKMASFALAALLTIGLCGQVAHAEEISTLNDNIVHVENQDLNKIYVDGANLLDIKKQPVQYYCSSLYQDAAYQEIYALDAKIQKKIDQASKQANILVEKYKKDVDSLEKDENGNYVHPEIYDQLSKKLDKSIDGIIVKLVRDTQNLVKKMEIIADANGIQIVNEYILVQIGDQSVWIDPIRVLGD